MKTILTKMTMTIVTAQCETFFIFLAAAFVNRNARAIPLHYEKTRT